MLDNYHKRDPRFWWFYKGKYITLIILILVLIIWIFEKTVSQ